MSMRRRIVRKLSVAVVLGVMAVTAGGVVHAEDCWDLLGDAVVAAASSCGGSACPRAPPLSLATENYKPPNTGRLSERLPPVSPDPPR